MSATCSRRHALQLAASALVVSLGLTACGGGSSDSGSSSTDYSAYGWSNVTALKIVDNTVGTGAAATTGTTATVTYTLYLYDVRVASTKGTNLQTSSFSFKLGNNEVVSGFDTGVNGMKVGGSRTVTIPASLAYGSKGTTDGTVPANAALVFDITLTAVN